MRDAISAAKSAGRLRIPLSCLTAVLFLGSGQSSPMENETACWFAEKLNTGEGLTRRDPVHHLRNRLISQNTPKDVLTVNAKRHMLTLAWNKTVRGETCSSRQLAVYMTGPRRNSVPNVVLIAE